MFPWFFDSKMHLKFEEKPFKFDAYKQRVFGFDFWMDFCSCGLWKRRQNRTIFVLLSKTLILQKWLFSLRKIAIFLVRSFQKSTEIRCSNVLQNNVERKNREIEFGSPFGLPKSLKICPKSDVKRNLFHGAMEITRKSSQVSGPRSFATVTLVVQRIRSALSVSLSLCLSVLICPSSP